MERVLSSSPVAALYMDQDVYIKTNLPLSIKHLKDNRYHRFLTMNEFHKENVDDVGGGWNHDVKKGFSIYTSLHNVPHINTTMPMPVMQSLFETHRGFAKDMYENGVLNSGGAWLELGHPRRSSAMHLSTSFLHEWWAMGRILDGGKSLKVFPCEQNILNVVMSMRADVRARTSLLEDVDYNSPVSKCMPHLYGAFKLTPKYKEEVMRTLLAKSVGFLDRLPTVIVPHTRYEMSHTIHGISRAKPGLS